MGNGMKVIAIIRARNEEEFIAKNIDNSRKQGLFPIVINNECTDRTLDCIDKDVPVFNYEANRYYDMRGIINYGIRKAKEIGCDWYILKDADEMLETYDGRSVVDVVSEAHLGGYNCMNCDSYSFWATVDDDGGIEDFTQRMQYYTFFNMPHIKAIRNSAEIQTSHPHSPGGVVHKSPVNLIIRHYKFLNAEQGRHKVESRTSRYNPAEIARGEHIHYRGLVGKKDDGHYVLEKGTYTKLNKFDGTWIRKQVWSEWRGW